MDNKIPTKNDQFEHDLPRQHEFRNATDTAGLWFAAAVLFAILAAGIIVYRGINSDPVRTAANDVPAAAHADPVWPSTILPSR
jgi:hypothetical protein